MARQKSSPEQQHQPTELRIIGGKYRGSKLRYHGDPQTRPMKERVREAIFNLITTEAKGTHAIDLFAGTGALGLEALSRGAEHATFIEKHVPTGRVVEENIAALQIEKCSTLLMTSAFLWGKRDLPQMETQRPWIVFCSPPYFFYGERQADMLELIESVMKYAPEKSVIVVESDEHFDPSILPGGLQQEKHGAGWRVNTYPPAVVSIWRKN